MKHRKLFTALAILLLVVLTMGAGRRSEDFKRMGIFISNFTEAGIYDIEIEEYESPAKVGELIKFGIMHNVINNPKTTIKRCTDRRCDYGRHVISGRSVAASVRKYFDLSIKNQTIDDSGAEIYYDGSNYHIEADDWKPDTVYYAEVQEVDRGRRVITMTGELYNLKNKRDRPATFTATAKPHVWDDKDTWAILSLHVDWR